MDWGNSVLQWLASEEGWRVLSGAIIPAVAIVVAGIVAAIIGRATTRRLIAMHQRDALAAALGGFLLAGRKAAGWYALNDTERVQVDHLVAEVETRIRLLPIAGANLAATWAAHELESMKRDSAGFRFQAQQTLGDYRDRLVAWSEKPRQAKKLFGADLERWRFEVGDETALDGAEAPVTAGTAGFDASPATAEPAERWIPHTEPGDPSPLTPEPPTAVATATGSMPLIITSPLPASTVRERVLPASAS
jgi:hypothetical protein